MMKWRWSLLSQPLFAPMSAAGSILPSQRRTAKPSERDSQTSGPRPTASYIASDINTTAQDVVEARLRICAQIARRLLAQLFTELERHGLLQDYLGYPYRSSAMESAWDFDLLPGSCSFVHIDRKPEEHGAFVVGRHKELWKDSLRLLKRDLEARGFFVRKLCFQEELIRFGDGRFARGIGLEWSLECRT